MPLFEPKHVGNKIKFYMRYPNPYNRTLLINHRKWNVAAFHGFLISGCVRNILEGSSSNVTNRYYHCFDLTKLSPVIVPWCLVSGNILSHHFSNYANWIVPCGLAVNAFGNTIVEFRQPNLTPALHFLATSATQNDNNPTLATLNLFFLQSAWPLW